MNLLSHMILLQNNLWYFMLHMWVIYSVLYLNPIWLDYLIMGSTKKKEQNYKNNYFHYFNFN